MHLTAASHALYPPSPLRVLRRLPCASSAVSLARPPPSPPRVLRRLSCASSAISLTRPPPSPVRVFVISSMRNLPSLLLVFTISPTRPAHLPYASSAISFACFCYLLCASSTISCTGPLLSALQILH
ncbi:hypothetical protein PoB_005220900 [Plakobranchus ocellatus]|uniref:Uncharacterized protein n=1 Tax=Plakobranchus ocellatus TaxID=259542 RepID=A0AAV4C3J3_9GAST|nr:hypothetical protein PoB_005220900 [Plakobranchus ocellatus]